MSTEYRITDPVIDQLENLNEELGLARELIEDIIGSQWLDLELEEGNARRAKLLARLQKTILPLPYLAQGITSIEVD
jgi:hypothetical protein